MLFFLLTLLFVSTCLASVEDNTNNFVQVLNGQGWTGLEQFFDDDTVYRSQLEPWGGEYIGKKGFANMMAKNTNVLENNEQGASMSMISEETLSSIVDTTYDLTWLNSQKEFKGNGKLLLWWNSDGTLKEIKEYVLNPAELISSYAGPTEQALTHMVKSWMEGDTEAAWELIDEDFVYNITNGLGDWDLALTGREAMKQLWTCMQDESCDEADFTGANKDAVNKLERLQQQMSPSLLENLQYKILLANSSHVFLDALMGPEQRYGSLVVLEFVNKTDTATNSTGEGEEEEEEQEEEEEEGVLLLKSETITLYNPTGMWINQAVYGHTVGGAHDGEGSDEEDEEDSDSDSDHEDDEE